MFAFLQTWLTIVKLLSLYTKLKQISKYIEDNMTRFLPVEKGITSMYGVRLRCTP